MKILMITQKVNPSDPILGFAYYWIKEISKHTDLLHVICLSSAKDIAIKGVEISSIAPTNKMLRIAKLWNFYKSASMQILKAGTNGIFVHQCPVYAILIYPLARIKKIPIVLWYTHGHVSLALRIASKLVNIILTATRESCRVRSNKIKVVGHGIDVERFSDGVRVNRTASEEEAVPGDEAFAGIMRDIINICSSGRKVILSPGRIAPVKDYETLIKAVHYLLNDRNVCNFKVEIIGDIISEQDRNYYESLKKRVISMKLQEYIAFRGAISYLKMHLLYEKCDIVISTSRTGSLDKVILEAMAAGKPVITSLPLDELFGMYSNSLTYAAGDHIALAENILSLLNCEQDEREKLAIYLRSVVREQHSLSYLAKAIVDEFHR